MEAATGKEVSRLAHGDSVNAVAFSPDGKWVATGDDNNVRVMEAATGKELVRHQMNGRVATVSFLGDSTLVVATATPAAEIEISQLSLDPAELIRDACSRLPRNLTRDEWDRYLHGETYRATCPNLPLEPIAKQ
jgi:WD40 repeat protein